MEFPGVTCARTFENLMKQVRLTLVSGEIKNTFFSQNTLMYIYMGHMNFEHTQPYENWFFWKKNRLELKEEWV